MAFGQTLPLTIDPGALPQATVTSGLRPEFRFPISHFFSRLHDENQPFGFSQQWRSYSRFGGNLLRNNKFPGYSPEIQQIRGSADMFRPLRGGNTITYATPSCNRRSSC